jgi:putative membrane protein
MFSFIKILHILAFTSWMAGLFYLPRIFVYHSEYGTNNRSISDVFLIMERKLYGFIMMPAMITTWVTGFYLAFYLGHMKSIPLWLVGKLICIMLLTGFHFFCKFCIYELHNKASKITGLQFRVLNEIPTVLLIVIVVLVVAQPDW